MISIYVIQIALILVLGLLFRNNKKKFLISAFIVLFIVMAFRHARLVGYDSTAGYFVQFQVDYKEELGSLNPGVHLVMKLIHLFTDDYQWFIVITAMWVCFAYYRLLLKYSENAFLSVMWFMGMLFYTFLFSALKQAWAMAFLCFAFDAIMKKKPIRFLMLVGLAAFFHFPALVFIPAYWIAKLRVNRSFPILMMSTLVLVFIFRSQLLDLMTSAYSKGEGEYASGVQFIGTKFIFMVLMLAYGFYRYYKYNNNAVGRNLFSVLIYFMGIAAVIQTFCFYSNNFERLADYYYQFSILFVPLILSSKDYRLNRIEKNDQSIIGNNSNSDEALVKKKISNYSINDIDVNTILIIIVTVFCVWRFLSYMVNDAYLSPFYFFWENVKISPRLR